MWPDRLAFHINACPFGPKRDSLDAELEALVSAVCLLQYEQNVDTIFHTDCLGVLKGVREHRNVGAKANSRRFYMLQFLRRFFIKKGNWELKWVLGDNNRIADRLSRNRSAKYVCSLKMNEHQFYCENAPKKKPIQTQPTPVKPKKKKNNIPPPFEGLYPAKIVEQGTIPNSIPPNMTSREYLSSSLGLAPFQTYACA